MTTTDLNSLGTAPNESPAVENTPAQVLIIDAHGGTPDTPAEETADPLPSDPTPTEEVPEEQPVAAPSAKEVPEEQPVATPSAKEELPTQSPAMIDAETALRQQSVDQTPPEKTPVEATPVERRAAPTSILTVDIGGTKVKILATGQTESRKAPSGKEFTPSRLVETVRALAHDWEYDAVSIGFPGLVGSHGPRSEPGNLGPGWVGFDFAAAFDKPVKMVNDAAMQALGSYEGGRMLFLGLGTGLGSALISGHVIIPLELGRLLYDGERTLGEVLGRRGFDRLGKGEWRRAVTKVVTNLMQAFVADYVVIGGGNAKNVKEPPPGARLGHNLTAFRGGFRLWSVEDVWVLAASGGESPQATVQEALRLL